MTITDIFAENVFNDKAMKNTLPPEIYASLQKTVNENLPLDEDIAKAVAEAMKDWAISKGATHFTHWFQPMTGITAEKHDSFISRDRQGNPIMEFSGKELIKGEPDASSFPNGGTRATFEARGYTAWDPTSPAFIKDNALCIPTAFCSYSGEALDKKTPLLRSMDAVNKQAKRLLKLVTGVEYKKIIPTVGAEQEYFLIDKEVAKERKDLLITGRTLFGARPPKGQELSDHYFGTIKPRVAAFMRELDVELWKLGVMAKTEHNEAAPAQHELAPLFETVNIAADDNQLTMEMMKKIADKNGMICLLHEKPFRYVNGSGKHNNWSLVTDDGKNLLDPGKAPSDNHIFLLLICALVKACDEYQDVLRLSVAGAGNDRRLGANEAPPAIVSVYLGDELTAILDAIEHNQAYAGKDRELMKLGSKILPRLTKDTTDRNRTSPMAFTGNKFEFRMPGSSASISGVNIVLNTIMAKAFDDFVTVLEGETDVADGVHRLIAETYSKHKRIVFNGNSYSNEWRLEAKKRGLLNLRNAPEAIPTFYERKNITTFEKYKVLSEREIHLRCEVMLENYIKTLKIEARTMADMAQQTIFPSVNAYVEELLTGIKLKRELLNDECAEQTALAAELNALNTKMLCAVKQLKQQLEEAEKIKKTEKRAVFFGKEVSETMEEIRCAADKAEELSASEYRAMPSYADILFSVN